MGRINLFLIEILTYSKKFKFLNAPDTDPII